MGDKRNRLSEADTLQRRKRMLDMRRARRTWQEIADTLGYASEGAACTDYKRVLQQRRNETNLTADEHIQAELEHLEALSAEALALLERDYDRWAGEEAGAVFDPQPKFQAIETLRRLSESRRKLLGLDAPTRVESDGQLKVIVEGVNLEDLT